MLNILAGIVPFLLILSVIVTFHEYGHYSVARLFKTRIDRFSVGFGPILLKRVDKRGVEWCLSAIPLGGYVKFAGDANIASMMPSAEELDDARQAITAREGAAAVKDYFHFKPIWQRFLIILAGPAFNFILAIAIYTALIFAFGETYTPANVERTEPNSPAAVAGFLPGDHIVAVDGHPVDSFEDVSNLVMLRANSRVPFVVERGNQTVTLFATPMRQERVLPDGHSKGKVGYLGLRAVDKRLTRRFDLVQSAGRGVLHTWQSLDATLTYISRIFTGKEDGGQLSGPIGMAKRAGSDTADVAMAKAPLIAKVEYLVLRYIELIAGISIAVGFVNLLPIPVLDGGHLLFYLYQGIVRRPVPQVVQTVGLRIAVVLILGLMVFAGWNDLFR
ncbi:MAG TPA: M50 family metallopeptidase [Asticcacaulis sp.]|nr:M50 family metallopeptidase [Asticcacaulis sp.]